MALGNSFACLILGNLARTRAVNVSQLQISEIDQPTPVDIGHAVPTGPMALTRIAQLNLPVWARTVVGASISAVSTSSSDPSTHLDDIREFVLARIDPEFDVHVCLLTMVAAGEAVPNECNITVAPTEDKNRYIDMRMYCIIANSTAVGVRVVAAVDAAKAVNRPQSFDVVLEALQVDGRPVAKDAIGRNQDPHDAGTYLNDHHLTWANSSLIEAVVETTRNWPWKPCSNRTVSANAAPDFRGELKAAISKLLDSVAGRWEVSFDAPVRGRSGIRFTTYYGLCGHLMYIPVTVESADLHIPVAVEPPDIYSDAEFRFHV